MHLSRITHRFNKGCGCLQQALEMWVRGDLQNYEALLTEAASELGGALEWSIKHYLNYVCNHRTSLEDKRLLSEYLKFYQLMNLMSKYADPPLDQGVAASLGSFRHNSRNPSEHNGAVPSCVELVPAARQIRDFILTYLSVKPEDLHEAPDMSGPGALRTQYLGTLQSKCAFMDFGGISPRVGGKIVQIKMDALFIPLQAKIEQPLLDSLPYADEVRSEPQDYEETEGSRVHLEGSRQIDIKEMLENPRVVILGHPGSGKTTVAQYITYSIALGEVARVGHGLDGYIPVLLKAADFGAALKQDPSLSLYRFIINKHTATFGRLFEWGLRKGECLVIIDGLDEIPDSGLRSATTRRVEDFLNEFGHNRFVITSRIVGYRENRLSGDFLHVTLSDLDDPQIQEFLEHWFRSIEIETDAVESNSSSKASELFQAIRGNQGIHKLAGNPLLLTIIALASWRGTKLPDRRVDLYAVATETLIENWPLKQRHLVFHAEEILKLLEPVAYQILSTGTRNLISEYELLPIFEQQVCEVHRKTPEEAHALCRDLLRMIEEHTGFFLAKGSYEGQNHYGFLHLTFAEYLTAKYLAEQLPDGPNLEEYVHKPRWREVLLLLVGHVAVFSTKQASLLVERILKLQSPYEEYVHRDLLFAAEILAENVRVRSDIQDEIVFKLVDLALEMPITNMWEVVMDRLSGITRLFPCGDPGARVRWSSSDTLEMSCRKAAVMAALGKRTPENLRAVFEGLQHERRSSGTYSPLFRAFVEHPNGRYLLILPVDEGLGPSHKISEDDGALILSLGIKPRGVTEFVSLVFEGTESGGDIWLIDSEELCGLGPQQVARFLSATKWDNTFYLQEALSHCQDFYAKVTQELLRIACEGSLEKERVGALYAIGFSRLDDDAYIRLGSLASASDQPVNVRAKAFQLLLRGNRSTKSFEAVATKLLNENDETLKLMAATVLIELAESPHEWREKMPPKESALLRIRTRSFTQDDVGQLLEHLGEPLYSNPSGPWNWLKDLLILASATNNSQILKAIGQRLRTFIETLAARGQDRRVSYWVPPWWDSHTLRPKAELLEELSDLLDRPEPMVRRMAISFMVSSIPGGDLRNRILTMLSDSDSGVRATAFQALRSDDLNNAAHVDAAFAALELDDSTLRMNASEALSRAREPMRQGIIDRLAKRVRELPDNDTMLGALWNMFTEEATGRESLIEWIVVPDELV